MTDVHAVDPSAGPMSCREATARLWEYLDGELNVEHSAGVRRHVAACPSCAARHDGALALLRTVLRTRHADAVPPTLRPRVTAMLRAQGLLA